MQEHVEILLKYALTPQKGDVAMGMLLVGQPELAISNYEWAQKPNKLDISAGEIAKMSAIKPLYTSELVEQYMASGLISDNFKIPGQE